RRFSINLKEAFPEDYARQNRMAIISNGMVFMAHLAISTCFSVNGVAALHTEILRTKELKDWADFYPQKFNNKTNGVTQRRWLLSSNPRLAKFITARIGDGW
ncbi:MAG TPA: glycogen phosphorylase, partial [Treponema sp.]|nr:glycogen phosphorylase [Treponema sp.]